MEGEESLTSRVEREMIDAINGFGEGQVRKQETLLAWRFNKDKVKIKYRKLLRIADSSRFHIIVFSFLV